MKNRSRWTINVLVVSSSIADFESDLQAEEEMVTFDQILATEDEIKSIVTDAFSNRGRFSLTFPESYTVHSFHTPISNLIHLSILREGRNGKNESKKIMDTVNNILKN